MVCFLMFFEDSVSAVGSLATGEAFPALEVLNCLTSESRGGDETRHKYPTHSEWHTDSKFVGFIRLDLAGKCDDFLSCMWRLQQSS